jgi:hypothetical protein
MQQALNNLDRDILTGAVADLQKFAATPCLPGGGHGELHTAIADARGGLVKCAPCRWVGPTGGDAAFRMAISRAYKRLESRGLVERIALGICGDRVSHLRPTAEGITLAAQLRSEQPAEATQSQLSE